ncbi:MAG: RNA polymerase Rpb4 family protein [Candidatus Methanospirareceae archaeon]
MIVKSVISEEILTLAETKEILEKIKEEGGGSLDEMRYEKRKALGHVTKFAKIDAKKAKLLVEELLKMEKMSKEIAVQIADLMPRSSNEVRAIYAKERFTLTEGDIEKILDCVARYE